MFCPTVLSLYYISEVGSQLLCLIFFFILPLTSMTWKTALPNSLKNNNKCQRVYLFIKTNKRQLFPSYLSQNIMTRCPLYITTRGYYHLNKYMDKVENILKGSLDLIQSPSPWLKIQIIGGKVCLRCKGKTLLGIVNKLFVFKSLLKKPSNVLPLHLKQTFLPIIWIFTEGDGIKSRLPFKIFSTLTIVLKTPSLRSR